MKKYPTIELSKFKSCNQAFSIAFAFPESGPLVIKGMQKDVEDYIKNNLQLCHYKMTLWRNNSKREFWKVNDDAWGISKDNDEWNFKLNGQIKFKLKWIPKKYLKSLEQTRISSISDIL